MTEKNSVDIYQELPQAKGQRLKFSSATPFVPTFVTSSVTQVSDPAEIYASRVHGRKILLENPARESRTKKEREEKRKRRVADKEKKRLGIISRREAKEKGVWQLDESQAKFDLFLPLHHLWMGYMSELLGLSQPSNKVPTTKDVPSSSGMHPKLVKADFHGSIITVRQSKCPSLIGLSGIVIHESGNAVRIITRENKIKLIPKQNSIFVFAVPVYSTLPPSHTSDSPFPVATIDQGKTTVLNSPYIEFELHGNQFRFRSADRAGRKFKPKETIELT
ncbi:ribonuclease p complex subunit [Moniliophthora roreri MCA 2997]|uniref:Ribonuclease p complex subunit n=1 Tax=Moniliophthora roreri (strain MCA 2997) TaxID=1381753 RepID=V2WYD7_MONRO|nr:ribonuclease p complex subunit [Moniliophthora roreri MCA 2997]